MILSMAIVIWLLFAVGSIASYIAGNKDERYDALYFYMVRGFFYTSTFIAGTMYALIKFAIL